MNSSLKYTLLDSQLNHNPIILHKNERKPIFQTRPNPNGNNSSNQQKSLLSLKNEQILELFIKPFSVIAPSDTDIEEAGSDINLQCVCSGHCCQNTQGSSSSQEDPNLIEMECMHNQAHGQKQFGMHDNQHIEDHEYFQANGQHDGKAVSNVKSSDQVQQKMRLYQDRVRLQARQRANLKKLGDTPGLMNLLRVDPRSGLSNYNSTDLTQRMKSYGANRIIVGKHVSFKNIMAENFFRVKNLMIVAIGLVLMAIRSYEVYTQIGSFVAIFSTNEIFLEMGTILMIATNFIAKCIKRWFVDKDFNNLVCVNTEYKAKVLRNSQVQYIKSTQLVVGDIMMIEAGDIINVDGILIESNDLKVNESSLISGRENVPKQAQDRGSLYVDCFIYSGTQIMAGQGEMIVCCVGSQSLLDRVQKTSSNSIYKNPLGDKLQAVQQKIGSSSTNTSTLIIFVIMFEYFWQAHQFNRVFTLQTMSDFLQLCQMILALSFLLMPEGLTEALDTYLSYSVKQLEPQDVIIKDLSALEWMGFVDSIVTDKTGCVTENNNHVEKIYTHEEQSVDDIVVKKVIVGRNKKIEQLLLENICINSAGVLSKEVSASSSSSTLGKPHNKTVEQAMLEFAMKAGYDYERFRIQSKIKKIYHFNPKSKRMITLFQKNQNVLRVYYKGQPDIILDKCTRVINQEGKPTEMVSFVKKQIQDRLAQYSAKESLKLIFFGYKDLDYDPTQIYSEELLNQDLIFVGIVCIRDPFRTEMPQSLKLCTEADVAVRALTGDNKESAVSTAKLIGLLPENFDYHTSNMAVLDGDQFKKIIDSIESFQSRVGGGGSTIQKLRGIDQFQKHIKELRMISKGRTYEKDALVTGLIQLKYIVAVTGDDTEDIKIIKKAQVGIGLGQSGNEVVKQAASIILKKDSFASIIAAILWGRNIYEFVRKYFQLIISQNQIIILLLVLNVLVWERHLFNASQFLLLNVLVDEFAAHALARESPSQHLLAQPPIRRKEYIIKPVMWRNILFETLYQIAVLSMLLFGDLEMIFSLQNQIFSVDQSNIQKYFYKNLPENGVIDENATTAAAILYKQHLRFRYSLCFNCLVFLQLFSILSCSSLQQAKISVWSDFKRKFSLVASVLLILSFFIFLMRYLHDYFDCVQHGFPEYFLCMSICITKLIYNYLVRWINQRIFARIRFVKYTFDFE